MATYKKLPKGRKVSTTDMIENTERADGTSLELGSATYASYQAGRQGMDDFEKEDQKLSDAGFTTRFEFEKSDDDILKERSADASYVGGIKSKLAANNYGDLEVGERIVRKEIRKDIAAESAFAQARKEAAITEEVDDDNFVSRKLPKALEEDVYDRAKDEDDIYPGQRILEKYM